jgi:hypothetical protein
LGAGLTRLLATTKAAIAIACVPAGRQKNYLSK